MRKSNIYYTTIKILIVYFPRFHFYSSAIVSHKENVQLSIFLCKTTFLDLTLWSQASNMLQIYFDVLLTINISSSRCIRNRLIIYRKWSYQSTTLKCIGPERLKISSLASITPYITSFIFYWKHLKWICHRGKEMFSITCEIFVQLLLYLCRYGSLSTI